MVAVAGAVTLACGRESGTHPTGVREVDNVIGAVEGQDLDKLQSLVRYLQEPCSTSPQTDPSTLYTPPACPKGTTDGTPVDVVISGNCEVGPTPAEHVEEVLSGLVNTQQQAYAVVGPANIFRWQADYVILLARERQPDAPQSMTVGVRDGGIMAIAGWCGPVSEALGSFTSSGSEVVWRAPQLGLSVD